jgi:hypothetical protein
MSDTDTLNKPAPTENATAAQTIMLPPETPMVGTGTPGMITRIFTGQLNANQSAVNTVFTLPGWTSSLLSITVLAADVNSDTNSLYFSGSYAWYRQWSQAPQMHALQAAYNWGQGGLYSVSTLANGNDIQVKLTQGAVATNTFYQIIAQYMLNQPS